MGYFHQHQVQAMTNNMVVQISDENYAMQGPNQVEDDTFAIIMTHRGDES